MSESKSLVLVTGGAGFIGSNIVKVLIENGYRVKIIDDLSTGSLENIKDLKVEFIRGSILDAHIVDMACVNVDIVFHLAAFVGRQKSIDNPLKDSEVNILGTLNLLESMKKYGVKKIVYSSSAAIFGELKNALINENHELNPNCQYGVSKLAAEKMIIVYNKLYNIPYVSLRYFNIYGDGQMYDFYGNVIPIFAKRIVNDENIIIYGDGSQTRDFLHVRDVARANLLAAESNFVGELNLGSGSSVTINDLAKRMINISGSSINVTYKPPRIGDVLHCKADISKASEVIGFKPSIEFNVGLRNYINWFKQTNK